MENTSQCRNHAHPVCAVGCLNCIYVADIAMLYDISGKKISALCRDVGSADG